MITSKCDAQHTIDFDTLVCSLTKGHDGMHKHEYCKSFVLWSVEYD